MWALHLLRAPSYICSDHDRVAWGMDPEILILEVTDLPQSCTQACIPLNSWTKINHDDGLWILDRPSSMPLPVGGWQLEHGNHYLR